MKHTLEIAFSDNGRADFLSLEKTLQKFFKKQLEKLKTTPPRRHLKFGVPYNVEDITRQARLIYEIQDEVLRVVHCFATHKEYEKWYNSLK